MKKVIYSALLLGAFAMGTSSCTKTCDPGYEGSDCKTEVRAKYIGSYRVSGTDTDGDTYTNVPVSIANSSTDVEKVILTWDGAVVLTGDVSSTGITFPSQTTAGETISGTATLTNTTLGLTLTVAGTNGYTITASGSKI